LVFLPEPDGAMREPEAWGGPLFENADEPP